MENTIEPQWHDENDKSRIDFWALRASCHCGKWILKTGRFV